MTSQLYKVFLKRNSINQYLLIQIKNIQKQYYPPTETRARKAGAAQMHKKTQRLVILIIPKGERKN